MGYEKMVALVVDDFPTMRRIVRNHLRDLEFKEVHVAENGKEALDFLMGNKVDLIVCDWNMPEMTGLELLQAVRSTEGLKHLPFLMVTAEAKKENIMEAVKAKVSNYIVKPFTFDTLKEKLDKILPAG